MKKFVMLLFVITISTLCLLAFSACAPAGKTNDTPTENDTLQTIYGTYVAFAEGNGTDPLSYEEWLESVKGKDGADGASVTKAVIDEDGFLVLTLSNGNVLLAGKVKGEDGKDGTDGTNGTDGVSVTNAEINGAGELIITLSNGQTINAGKAKGEDGKDGTDGSNGANGANGSDGENGVSVSTIELNEQGEFVITLSDGSVKTVKMPEHEHAYGDWVTEVLPECEAKGLKYRTCTVCGEKEYTFIDALGHTPDDGVVIHPATETTSGVIIYTCQTCGKSYVELIPVIHVTEGLEYTLNEDGESYSVTGIGTATDTDIIIPSIHNGKPVTKIGEYAFYYCRSLTSIDIPDSVTKVGELAFYDCGAQSEIDGFYVVDDWVFDARSFPSTVIIPEGIVGIADYTFSESGIESATFPSTLKYVGYASFWDSCLKYISFENPDVIINSRAFSQTFLNKIDYNGTTKQWLALNYIENSCESYKVYCTDGILNRDGSEHLEVTPNEYFTFTYIQATNSYSVKIATTSMPEIVVIPSEYNDKPVTQIASSAFSYSYNKIKRIVIPDSITIIGDWAFCDCVELENINIPDGITIIGRSVFEHCYKLANVQIPFGVESIGLNAFRYCYLSSIEIPDSVTGIGEDAFYNCSNLTSVTIGNGVTSIGRGAFDDCSSLTSVTIGNGVTSIGDYAFSNCRSLTSIDIPDSVTSIGNSAFYNCSSLTNVTIGNGVTSIGDYAFDGCSSLTKVYYKGTADDWNAISIDNTYSYNSRLINATRYYYSETQPTESGNYWHYDGGGNVVEW